MLNRTSWSRSRRLRRPLPPAWAAILESQVAYYRCLPGPQQQALRKLLMVLMGEVPFEAAAGLERVEDEMRVMVLSQACVLLLGRTLRDLPRLRSVILYPGAYRARERLHTPEGVLVETSEVRRGESWVDGPLLLSWEDVLYDAVNVDDGENIVFHEMAHALDEQTGEADGFPLLQDAETARAWATAFQGAYQGLVEEVERGAETLLDPYAAEDAAEFFAVAVEAFLEMPAAFGEAYPALYRLMAEHFQLDPARWDAELTQVRRPGR